MNHTEEFNKIMQRTAPAKKIKIAPVKCEQVQGFEGMNDLQTDLSNCYLSGNVLQLPKTKLIDYSNLRKSLLNCGASYKSNTFVFPNEAKPYILKLMQGETINLKKEFQFFATPKELAEEMASFLNVTNPQMAILEPSAGQGALIEAVCERWEILKPIDYCELMDLNADILADKKLNAQMVNDDFLTMGVIPIYDRIIANPPFSKNQYIDHVYKMFDLLKFGGRIVCITSCHWLHSQGKKETAFKNWLDDMGATYEEVKEGTFKSSGTNIKTMFLVIDK
jgi:hypothetical protein